MIRALQESENGVFPGVEQMVWTRLRAILWIGFAGLLISSPCRADGLQDNHPEDVRRIPAPGIEVPSDRAEAIRLQLKQLQDLITAIRESKDATKLALLPDVMIFERAVRCALEYQEFFEIKEVDKADELLRIGIARAHQLAGGEPRWITQKGLVVRGYISRIDQTVQPYGLVIPATCDMDHSVPTRCDLWFHGRGEKLSEVNFLWDRMHNPGEFTPDHTIMLHPYGRYSNAFKFAGEIDVLEALQDVQQRYRIDEDRISVRGFSMGGAACWQFATHYADRWFAANPAAGFSETPQFLKVFQKEELNPTPWEQKLWNLYDCDKWALNLAHCPTIAYSGENDSQKQAADVMEQALAGHGIRLRHVIGKGMGHKFDTESKAIISNSLSELTKNGRTQVPRHIEFETYTLRYNQMHWVTVDSLENHWSRSVVRASVHRDQHQPDAELLIHLRTSNVSAITVSLPAGALPASDFSAHRSPAPRTAVHIRDLQPREANDKLRGELMVDGPLSDGSLHFSLERTKDGHWQVAGPLTSLRKRHGLQGPIDDAFMDSFVFVRPTGTAINEAVGHWVDTELTRAIEHWRRHFRGDARVVNDVDLTEDMIQSANIVLWGDPKSNSVLARIADQLPIQWTGENISVNDRTFDANTHAPILIYPNPLNQNRYVVLNSSFTFRDYAYLNNARQVPMLPDWAIVDLTTPPGNVWPGKVVAADFFDEFWSLKP